MRRIFPAVNKAVVGMVSPVRKRRVTIIVFAYFAPQWRGDITTWAEQENVSAITGRGGDGLEGHANVYLLSQYFLGS